MGIPPKRCILGAAIAVLVCGSCIASLVVSEAIDVTGWNYYSEILSGTCIAISTMVSAFALLLILSSFLGQSLHGGFLGCPVKVRSYAERHNLMKSTNQTRCTNIYGRKAEARLRFALDAIGHKRR